MGQTLHIDADEIATKAKGRKSKVEVTEDALREGPTSDVGRRLKSYIDRVERLEEERKALGSDIKDIFAEVKSAGFAVSVVKKLIRDRKKEPAEVEEEETLLDLYRRAIGD